MKAQTGGKTKIPARVFLGMALAVALSSWGAFQYFQAGQNILNYPDPFMVASQLRRFEPVRRTVPESIEVMGYFSDGGGDSGRELMMFDGARYAVAPRLLLPGVHGEWAVGNFTHAADVRAFGAGRGLRVERDFGDGLVLYRKTVP